MKELAQRLVGAIFDLKTIVGVSGVLISIAAHELFHIMVHWGEIDSVHFLPDVQAIVEVIFTPTADYNIPIEEALAYAVTMVALILTAMLIGDIHDLRDTKTVGQTVLASRSSRYSDIDEREAMERLGRILGVNA